MDDSDGARRALRWALALAEVTGATVQVVHVFPRHFSWIDGDLTAEELERSRRSALAVAERELAAVVDDVVAEPARGDAGAQRPCWATRVPC